MGSLKMYVHGKAPDWLACESRSMAVATGLQAVRKLEGGQTQYVTHTKRPLKNGRQGSAKCVRQAGSECTGGLAPSARRALWSFAAGRRIGARTFRTRSHRCERRQRDCPCGDQCPHGIETALADQPRRCRIAIVPADIDHVGVARRMVMWRGGCFGLRCGDVVAGIELRQDVLVT
jgi:hypothetical protein